MLLVLAGLASLAVGSQPLAAQGVVNGSFEDPVVTTIPGHLTSTAGPFCFASACPSIPGWSFEGLGGLFRPNGSVFPPGAFDGAQVYFSDGRGGGDAIATQNLAAVFAPLTDYTLTVAVGNRADVPWGDGFITLFAGGDPAQVVATFDLSDLAVPAPGQFVDVSLMATMADVAAAGALGQTIGIRMGGATVAQSIFDDVRLNVAVVPEPASATLFGAGLLAGWLGWRRRRGAWG